nr:DUF262 domain-containing HNH endonuclease family protein [Ferrimicrobium sp.]
MTDSAKFDHDHLGHLLSDRLLKVPRFQRRYSWRDEHILEYWADIQRAREANNSYFMGTIVLASDSSGDGRDLIIDGQQRITTTAVLLIAARDRLYGFEQDRAAQGLESSHLSDYVLTKEDTVAKLMLSPDDHDTYSRMLERKPVNDPRDGLANAYHLIRGCLDDLTPTPSEYRRLIDLVDFLDTQVQVLLAVASELPEAYVIFETLNDRGADLTTADLLKNYLFSVAGEQEIDHVEAVWTRLTGRFEQPENFVKVLRYEYMSQWGSVTNRALYKALQERIGKGATVVRTYVDRLEKAAQQYLALREPDDVSWSSQAIEVKDSLLAFRRFGFEASTPLLLAAFREWSHSEAVRFVDVVAAWSVRAWMAGLLGGGSAESAFSAAAVAISQGKAKGPEDVRELVRSLVPDDLAFKAAFTSYGTITTTRAKYILARLEQQELSEKGLNTESMPDWSSKGVTVEHIFAKSSGPSDFQTIDEYERFVALRDQLQNLTLLERTLNASLENKRFDDKHRTYGDSAFSLTRELSQYDTWSFELAARRAERLAELAVRAWPL